MASIKEQPTNDPDKLLKLIKEGDAELLLAEGDLGKGFNKLIQLELISIEDGEVCITTRGDEALKKGVEAVVSNPVETTVMQPVTNTTPLVKSQFQNKMGLLAVLLLLFIMILLAAQMLT